MGNTVTITIEAKKNTSWKLIQDDKRFRGSKPIHVYFWNENIDGKPEGNVIDYRRFVYYFCCLFLLKRRLDYQKARTIFNVKSMPNGISSIKSTNHFL